MRCRKNLSISERINQHIISKADCWLTDFSCTHNGYPRMGINGKMKKVSRVIYELNNGEIPPGKVVCHKCDNPACINPDHLFLGTQKDNIDDMVSKNRHACLKGSKAGSSKLNEEKVLEIKKLLAEKNLSQKEIGEKYGVCHQTISDIKTGKLWSHVVFINQPKIIFNGPVTINYSEAKQLGLFDE